MRHIAQKFLYVEAANPNLSQHQSFFLFKLVGGKWEYCKITAFSWQSGAINCRLIFRHKAQLIT